MTLRPPGGNLGYSDNHVCGCEAALQGQRRLSESRLMVTLFCGFAGASSAHPRAFARCVNTARMLVDDPKVTSPQSQGQRRKGR